MGLLLLGHLVFEGWRMEKRKMAAPVVPAACWSPGITWAQFSASPTCVYVSIRIAKKDALMIGGEGSTGKQPNAVFQKSWK